MPDEKWFELKFRHIDEHLERLRTDIGDLGHQIYRMEVDYSAFKSKVMVWGSVMGFIAGAVVSVAVKFIA